MQRFVSTKTMLNSPISNPAFQIPDPFRPWTTCQVSTNPQTLIHKPQPQMMRYSIKIVLPFFPVGTMERVDIEGEIATARTLARILSNVPSSRYIKPPGPPLRARDFARGPQTRPWSHSFDLCPVQHSFWFPSLTCRDWSPPLPLGMAGEGRGTW